MPIKVGDICEGTITGITNFGAFVALPEGKSGMVHISEVANAYVKDINEHLKDKQSVKVKVISIDEKGKISLSIKQAMEKEFDSGDKDKEEKPRESKPREHKTHIQENIIPGEWQPEYSGDSDFEGMMAKFKKISEERISDYKKSRFDKHTSYSKRK